MSSELGSSRCEEREEGVRVGRGESVEGDSRLVADPGVAVAEQEEESGDVLFGGKLPDVRPETVSEPDDVPP
jgi:hypothetical protein